MSASASNLGSGPANFTAAMSALQDRGYEALRSSLLYASEPWGGAEGGVFTNAVVELRRRGTARELLRDLLAVETALGRTRERPYAPRRCDLDLLFWNGDRIAEPDLLRAASAHRRTQLCADPAL